MSGVLSLLLFFFFFFTSADQRFRANGGSFTYAEDRARRGGAEVSRLPTGPLTIRATSFHVLLRSYKSPFSDSLEQLGTHGEEREGGRQSLRGEVIASSAL